MVKLLSAGATHVGLVRTNNEDAYLAMPEAGVFAISDGMGGAAAGEIASRYFIEAVQQVFIDHVLVSNEASGALVEEVFKRANKTILKHGAQNPQDEGLGCTGDLLVFHGANYVTGHVGDSRVYMARDGHLRQLTRDQSLVQGLVDEGILTPEEARHHPRKNIILQALGTDPSVSPDILKGEAINHDIFLLCSDGLTDMVDDSAIRDMLISPKSLDDKAENLIEAALAGGGKDNVTVVLCEVEIRD
jgi:PPM family protein phosphatase